MTTDNNNSPDTTPGVTVTTSEALSYKLDAPRPIESIRASTGVLGTATTRQGGVISSRAVEPSDLVSILNGTMQTTVQRALDLGYLAKDSQGRIVDVAQTPDMVRAKEAAEAAKQGPDDTNAMEASHETSHGLGFLVEAVQATDMHPTQAVAAVMSGNVDKLVSALSVAHRAPASEVRDFIMTTGASLEADLAADLGKTVGVQDLPACWAYLRETVPSGVLGTAINALVFQGDARPMRELAGRFMSSGAARRGARADGDLAAGVKVNIRGREQVVSRAYALRSGLQIK